MNPTGVPRPNGMAHKQREAHRMDFMDKFMTIAFIVVDKFMDIFDVFKSFFGLFKKEEEEETTSAA